MTDNDTREETSKNSKDEVTTNETDQMSTSMSASMSELVMNSSQHENSAEPNDRQHKLSVASSINGHEDGNNAQKQVSGTAKLESQPKEKLIQLIRKQLLIIKQERKAATDAKNETETLRQQITESESKKGADSMLSLELSDYKKGMEALRKKCESSDKELSEKDGMLKELSFKLHNLTEQNLQLTDTVSQQREEINVQTGKITALETKHSEAQNELEQQHTEAQNRLETSTKENEEMLETIKKLRKELKNIRNAGADNKQELNQLQKSNEILQKKYDDLTAEFSAYKEKAEFVLKQHNTDKQRVNETFEIEELHRQVKLKNEQINQLSDRSVGYQQEINSAHERCRLLRTELEDARQSMQIAQKQTAEERKKLAFEYEQRIRQLTKDLEDNKRDLLSIQEHASNERRKLDEIHTRVITELNLSIQDLQFRLNQSNVDKNSNAVNEVRQTTKEREKKRSTLVNPINFDTETRFNVEDLAKLNSSSNDNDDMLNSLHDLINGVETAHEHSHQFASHRSQSQASLNSWADPDDLDVQLQHTRSILREAEQTNAKLEAQVDLLKKELRRNESNNLSVQHINQNMGYFKNVMLKFLAPEKVNDGRVQMLPVLATMLALSTDEVKSIENALKAQQEERQASTSELAGYFGPLSGIF